MGLAEVIQSAAATAFQIAGNVAEACSYVPPPDAGDAYEPTLGTIDTSELESTPVIHAVFSAYSLREQLNESLQPTDQRCSVSRMLNTVAPVVNGTFVRSDGSVWKVIAVRTDPASAAWDLQVRRSG